jgi:hypothetical protein
MGLSYDAERAVLLVADSGNNRIRAVSAGSGAVSTLAGSGSPASGDGWAAEASFNSPRGLWTQPGCCLVVADASSNALRRVGCPLGVLAIIFEARPEAVVQIAALALKSGNAVILKGGKEAAHSNAALARVVRGAIAAAGAAGVPEDAVQLVSSREAVADLLRYDDLIDLVIPRGSMRLVREVKAATRIPVLGHADGICHVFLDANSYWCNNTSRDANSDRYCQLQLKRPSQPCCNCNQSRHLNCHSLISERDIYRFHNSCHTSLYNDRSCCN